MCKRPLDISAREGKEDFLEDANANCTNFVEQRDGSNIHFDPDLFRLRNGTVVCRVEVGDSVEHTYKVVCPLEFAEKQLELRHYGDPDPLTHSGGRLGPCYDIVGHVIKIENNKVYIPQRRKSRFAYVVTLWGTDPGFVLGALVLAGALKRTRSTEDRLLLHTDDLPKNWRNILAKAWDLVRVEYVDADAGLFHKKGTRFDGVFTKLHTLSLVEYEKVLVLDIDVAVMNRLDDLFDLPAPAAMHRSMSPVGHGSRINSRNFFAGEFVYPESGAYQWGQHGGINAGVMLLKPDERTHASALREVQVPLHPERIPGSGPEQDYLSRLFAPDWTQISVMWNYQLHRVFHALEAAVPHAALDEAQELPWQPERMSCDIEKVHIFHFSGTLKMWDRDFTQDLQDKDFAEEMLRASQDPYRLWFDRQGTTEEYAEYGVRYVPEEPECGNGHFLSTNGDVDITHVVQTGVEQAKAAALRAVTMWREDLENLRNTFPTLPNDLRYELSYTSWPTDAPFVKGARVQAQYHKNHQWYAATVTGAYEEDKLLCVMWDEPGWWGTVAHALSYDCLRPLEQ